MWLCIPYLSIDASTEEYEEEEAYEEEEENFDNCTNQGKLIPCMLLLMQAILVQASKAPIAIYLFREPYQSQVFTLQAFTFLFIKIFYSWPLSHLLDYYKSIKLSLDS